MRIGCCINSLDELTAAAAAGFDYAEVPTAALAAGEPDEAFEDNRRILLDSPLPVEVFYCFIPSALPLVGPSVDRDALRSYVRNALARAASVGARLFCFGSGRARRCPDGFPLDRAESQIADFLRLCAKEASPLGSTVGLEHLNPAEVNTVNTLGRAAELARDVGSPAIGVVADTYHMLSAGEALAAMADCADVLLHVHVAEPDRRPPGTGETDWAELARVLGRAGYRARVSCECLWDGPLTECGPRVADLLHTALGS